MRSNNNNNRSNVWKGITKTRIKIKEWQNNMNNEICTTDMEIKSNMIKSGMKIMVIKNSIK